MGLLTPLGGADPQVVRDFYRDPRATPNGEGTASISVTVFEKIDIEGIPLAPLAAKPHDEWFQNFYTVKRGIPSCDMGLKSKILRYKIF